MSSLFTDTIRKTGGTAGTDIKINNSSTYVDGSNKSQNKGPRDVPWGCGRMPSQGEREGFMHQVLVWP